MVKEYQACYYRNDLYFMAGDFTCFKSFDTPEECNAYIDKLKRTHKKGFIQLLRKSDPFWEQNFEIGDNILYHQGRKL